MGHPGLYNKNQIRDKTIDKVDNLSKDVEISRMEGNRTEHAEEKDFGNISYMLSMVAESGEYQYGAND